MLPPKSHSNHGLPAPASLPGRSEHSTPSYRVAHHPGYIELNHREGRRARLGTARLDSARTYALRRRLRSLALDVSTRRHAHHTTVGVRRAASYSVIWQIFQPPLS